MSQNTEEAHFIEPINMDKWIKEIMKWHFSDETGSEFWLSKKEDLDFDPIENVKCYEDLNKFGFFDDNELKQIPVEKLIPKGMMKKNNINYRVFETGGTLGIPKRIIDCTYRDKLAKWSQFAMEQHGFELKNKNWLHLGPAGPHVVGHSTGAVAQLNNAFCYYIDIDTRWIKLCIKNNQNNVMDEYIEHVIKQAINILMTQNISFITTTPKLLLELAKKISLDSIEGVILGGTHVTPSLHKLIRTNIIPNIPLCIMYGNTLAGVSPQSPHIEENGWDVCHYPFNPYFWLTVVEPDNPTEEVAYGDSGRVKICTLTHDYFIPNLLERDEAIRIPGNLTFPWDGVANVKPFSEMEENVIEGVY